MTVSLEQGLFHLSFIGGFRTCRYCYVQAWRWGYCILAAPPLFVLYVYISISALQVS